MSAQHILLADPDPATAEELRQVLGQGWIVTAVETGAGGLKELKSGKFDAALASLDLADMPAKHLLNRVRYKFPKTRRFIVANAEDRERMGKKELGAHQFLIRPFDPENLRTSLGAAALDRAPSPNAEQTFTVLTEVPVADGLEYLAPEQAQPPPCLPRPGLAFSPPPSHLVGSEQKAGHPPAENSRPPTPSLDALLAAAWNEDQTVISAQAGFEANAETRSPTLTRELPGLPPSGARQQDVVPLVNRNHWLVAAALPAAALLVAAVVLARIARDHQHSIAVQARQATSTVMAEPVVSNVPPEPGIGGRDLNQSGARSTAAARSKDAAQETKPEAVFPVASNQSSEAREQPQTPPVRPSFPELKLQGILFSPNRPAAIINGNLVHPRERLADALIIEIRPTTVTVEFQKERRVLTLQ